MSGYSKYGNRGLVVSKGAPNLQGTEAAFQDQVLELARLHGWLRHAERPAISRGGRWATPIQGEAGFPDLVLVHSKRRLLLFVELKMKGGKLSDGQRSWQDALNGVTFAGFAGVWRPDDWAEIEKTLSS